MSRVTCHAFTLVELIVVSALLMIVGGGLLTTFITGQTSYLSADAYVQVQQEARRAFDNVIRELREAGNVSPADVDINRLNFQIALGYNTIVGDVNCQNTGAICWGSEDATKPWVHYATIGTGNAAQLIRWLDADPAGVVVPGLCSAPTCRVLANHVQSASFNYSSPSDPPPNTDIITVKLQIQYNSPLLPTGSRSTPMLTSQVKLRN